MRGAGGTLPQRKKVWPRALLNFTALDEASSWLHPSESNMPHSRSGPCLLEGHPQAAQLVEGHVVGTRQGRVEGPFTQTSGLSSPVGA